MKFGAVLVTSLIAFFTNSAFAQQQTISLKQIHPVVTKYAESLGCGAEIVPKNLARFLVPGYEDSEIGTYIVAVNSDVGCQGGSGTNFANLIVVGSPSTIPDRIYVLPEFSQPGAQVIGAPRNITRLYVKNDALQATGLEYGDNDPNCCPSIKVIYRVELSSKEVELEKDNKQKVYLWRFIKIGNYK